MRRRRLRSWVALVAALWFGLCLASAAHAQRPPARVSVLTMGPGDHPFTRFGHNAILLEWAGGRSAVYNFGTFEFDGLKGAEDFMAGRFRYWLSVGSLEATLAAYRAERRSLTAQELTLVDSEREQLATMLADNALPEHRYYDYDYYRDNCSTRVRDVLDRVLEGKLGRSVRGSGRFTFRQHTLRLVGDTLWLYFGLDLALGSPTDRPTTRWEELFLPKELHDQLALTTRTLAEHDVPLVSEEHALLPDEREAVASAPPAMSRRFAELGSSLGLLLAAMGWGAKRRRALGIAFGAVTALLGGALGLLGSALAIFATSKHWAAHANKSLLACPPWSLALVVLGVAFALGRPKSAGRLQLLLGMSLVTSTLLLLLSLPSAGRESLRMAALFLPLWAGCFAGARLAAQKSA